MPVPSEVSVIVPAYNTGEQLIPTINSLLNQSLNALEIIIVNDASTDDTAAIIDQLADQNPKIIPIHFSENKGVHEARLAGLKKSSAPWIGFLDADDFARPEMFETLFSTAEHYAVDIVICGSDRVTPARQVIAQKLRFAQSEKVSSDVFQRFCQFDFGTGMLWNKLFKRSVIEPWFDLHFPWRQNINEDLLLNIGCFYRAETVYLLKNVLHEYVVSKSSVTAGMQNSWAYVETFRAYALAINCYQRLGSEAVANIIEMYRTQMSWGRYQLADINELAAHEKRLEEATRLLCDKNAYALSAIIPRQQNSHNRVTQTMYSLYAALKTRLKHFFDKLTGFLCL